MLGEHANANNAFNRLGTGHMSTVVAMGKALLVILQTKSYSMV